MIIQCRICLCVNADRDICSLPTDIGVEKTPEDVLLFSLGIELSNQSEITTKLCSKCHTNIQKYYKFKVLAQKSNSYLQYLNLRNNEKNDSMLTSDLKNDDDWIDIPIKQIKDELEEYNLEKKDPEVLNDNRDKENTTELISFKEEQHECFTPIPVLEAESKKKGKKRGYTPKNEKSLQKLFLCEPCGKIFSSKYSLQIHQGKFHSDSDTKKFQCDDCHQSFFRKFDLQRHIDKLHMEWRCRICNVLLNSRFRYLKHVKSAHQVVSPEVKSNFKVCPLCGKLISHLSAHLASHRGVLYPCKGCNKKYRSRAARDRHYKSVHLGVVYRCDICYKDVKDLLQHNKSYHKPDGRKHECQICGYRTISLSALTIHFTTHAAPHLPCPKCPKLFKDEARLKLHIRQVHEGELRHMCSECPKGFFYKSDLTLHMASHLTQRSFQCDHCYEPFKLRNHLVRHLKTKHTIM